VFHKIFIKFLLIFPLFIITLNIYNNFFPTDYRNDQYLIDGYFSQENKKILNFISEENRNEILEYRDAIKRFDKLYSIHGESLKFLNEAAKVYFISKVPTEYSWKEKYTKVKLQENWVLYFVRKFEEIQKKYTQKNKYYGSYIYYQSSDYKFALKRGISICSQDAVSFANLLKRRYNINSNIVGLGGHVLMQAQINNKYYLSDPNMSLTFDFSIDEYYDNDKNIMKIKKAYTGIGRPDLIKSFDKLNNRKFKYTGPKAIENTYNPDTIAFLSNYIKWPAPIILFLIGLYLNYKKRKV
jgi:hypothetical protein